MVRYRIDLIGDCSDNIAGIYEQISNNRFYNKSTDTSLVHHPNPSANVFSMFFGLSNWWTIETNNGITIYSSPDLNTWSKEYDAGGRREDCTNLIRIQIMADPNGLPESGSEYLPGLVGIKGDKGDSGILTFNNNPAFTSITISEDMEICGDLIVNSIKTKSASEVSFNNNISIEHGFGLTTDKISSPTGIIDMEGKIVMPDLTLSNVNTSSQKPLGILNGELVQINALICDARLKKDIELSNVEKMIEEFKSIETFTYRYKSEADFNKESDDFYKKPIYASKNKSEHLYHNPIAQNLRKIRPELVIGSEIDGFSIDFDMMHGYYIRIIQKLLKDNMECKIHIKNLMDKMDKM